MQVVKWLNKQKNPFGGFISTQVSIVAKNYLLPYVVKIGERHQNGHSKLKSRETGNAWFNKNVIYVNKVYPVIRCITFVDL